MRIRHKKLLVSGAAVTVAGVLGIGTLIQTSLSVKASSEMMPGIETIINENSGQKPFKILELTDSSDRAEIGYYVSGQEPYIKLYTWQYTDDNNETKTIHFNTLEEGLKLLPQGKRREFAMNIKLDEDGNINTVNSTGIRSVAEISTGDAESSPLSVSDYQEKYFLESGDNASDWKRIDFTDTEGNSRTDTIQAEGSYQENTEGTGDYTKEEQTYYPIRNDRTDDGANADTFRENIENFYFSEGDDDSSRGAYQLEFTSVSNQKVNKALDADGGKFDILPEYDYENQRYGYYENVYEDLTKEIVENISQGIYTFPGQNPSTDLTKAVLLADQPDEAAKRDPDEETPFGSGSEAADISSGETVVSSDTDDSGGDDFSGEDTTGENQVSFDNEFTGAGNLSTEDGSFGDESADEAVGADVSADTTDTDNTDNPGADAFSDSVSDGGTDMQTDDFSGENRNEDLSDQTENEVDTQASTDADTTSGILGEMKNDKAAGTQADPYIYLSESINEYPYFKYTLIGDLEYVKEKAVDITDPEHQDETRQAGDITLESDQYWYWKADDSGNLTKYPLTVVTGRQPVAYEDLKKIPDEIQYDYYFRVTKVYFCCTSTGDGGTPSDYKYTGWYFASYPQGQDPYLPVAEGETATHYISDAEYSLTPGTGSYDFVPGGDTKRIVQVNHMFYQGGYTNNDWFKKYVFHLTPKASADDADGQFENFDIQVDTRSSLDPKQEIYAIPADSEDTPSVGDVSSEENAVADQTDDLSSKDTGADSETEISDAGSEDVDTDSDETEVTDEDTDLDEVTAEDTDAAGAEAENLQTLMESYDLIYVNGKLSEAAVSAISQSSVPCIINHGNMEDTALGTLNSFTKADDDGHYVNTYVYFFKNLQVSGTADQSALVNTQFHTNFNDNADSDSYKPSEGAAGFEEILSYIESENKYRALGSKDDSDVQDGEDRKLDPLDKEISQAKAIEYIINYKYRRYLKKKSDVKVLEIEPAKSNSQIDRNKINAWLDDGKSENSLIQKVEVCCYNKEGVAGNLTDGNASTYWHSAYGSADSKDNYFDSSVTDKLAHINSKDPNHHWIMVTLGEATDISGFFYQPRPNGSPNGVVDQYTVELYDENDQLIRSVSGRTDLISKYSQDKKAYSFDQVVEGVKKVKFICGTTNASLAGDKNKFASCAQFGVIYRNVTMDTMTAAEFVGHTDDIASEYDLIYLGDDTANRNKFLNGSGNLLYAHVGAQVSALSGFGYYFSLARLLGQLDNEWDSSFVPADGYQRRFAPTNTYSENGGGYFRGSGNDMTRQECEKLKDFVKSGYPLVLGDSLVTGSGSDRKVNTGKVDAASYYYEFLSEALKYENTVTMTEAGNGKLSSFFVNLAKPVIDFTENGRPPEPERANDPGDGENTGNINSELKYVFTVENDSDAAPASSTYDCELYIDLNFDGVFSSKETQDKYMTITDSSGKVLSPVSYGKDDQRYQLKIGQQYTVIRKIPSDYYKLITWKLVLTSNENTYIHTSQTGYAKQNNVNGQKQTINVLQIIPDKGGKWRLANDNSLKKRLKNDVKDFDINIEEITVKNFAELADVKAKLDTKQMLIIGFDDVYQNIPNNRGQVDAILAFIKSGKSVIFSHDTTSYQYYKYSATYPRIAVSSYPIEGKNYYSVPRDGYLNRVGNEEWGISLNNILRSVVGMDRYGITSTESISADQTVSQLLKQGHELNSSEVSFSELMRLAGDVAYKTGDATRSESYAQTQGYTYKILEGRSLGDQALTNTAVKVNDGAITQYPYKVGANKATDDGSINISTTHGQYYQLALEQDYDINGRSDGETDVVVWYCLGGNSYADSPNDVRNNYYYYSKGNVIYTGSGHSTVGNNEDEVQLFINSIVAAANVTAVQPEINFVKELNPAAATESARYYMTDQSKWTQNEGNTLEKDMDFYINVKDYNMVSADLSDEDLSKQKMTVEFYIDDENGTPTPTSSGTRKLTNVTGAIGTLTEYGTGETISLSGNQFVLNQNNAYGFTMPEIEKYLRTSGNRYKKECRLYVKVSSTVYLYGAPTESTTWSYIDLKQRQLFELD